jgi:hypothetical protein
MASDWVFTNPDYQNNSGPETYTVYGLEKDLPKGHGPRILAIRGIAPSPWKKTTYPGYPGARAKFMGKKTRHIILDCMMFGGTEAGIISDMEAAMDLNGFAAYWTIKVGTNDFFSAGDLWVIEDVEFSPIGEGTGPQWLFKIPLTKITG